MTACVYFGVRTPKRDKTAQCRECKNSNFELFRKCTKETNTLMGTSIDVDKKGNTVEIPPVGLVSDKELVIENFNSPKKEEE